MSLRPDRQLVVGLAIVAVATTGLAYWHAAKAPTAPAHTSSTIEKLDLESRKTTSKIWFGDDKQ